MAKGPNARVRRLSNGACAAVAVTALLVPGAATAVKPKALRVKVPASAKYLGRAGQGKKLTLWVAGKSVQLVSFQFVGCRKAIGTTNLDGIRLHRARTGYRFAISAYGGVSYTDNRLDDNAAISIRGQFDSSGRAVRGTLSVKSPGCGTTGTVRWSARR